MKVRYTNTIEHRLAFNQFARTRSPTIRAAKIRGFIVPPTFFLLIFGLLALRAHRLMPLAFGLFPAIVSMAYYLLVYERRANRLTRQYLQEGTDPTVLCEHVLEVTPEFLVETTPLSELRSRWAAVQRVEETGDYAFVYVQRNAAHIVPRSAIVEGDFEGFLSAVRAAIAAGKQAGP